MNQSDAGIILAKCAAFDNRQPSAAAALAWAEALDNTVTVPDALQIIIRHYAHSSDWIMPRHINEQSRILRQKRWETFRSEHLDLYPDDPGLSPSQVNQWRGALVEAVKAGAPTRTRAEAHAWQTIGRQPPQLEETSHHPVPAINRKP